MIDNLKWLFNELLEIRYYVDEEKTYQENNLSVTLTLTNKCNLPCSHCALSASPLSQDILSTNDVKYAIDKVIDFNPNTLIQTGGESFIRKIY
ncbi:radical SAM protein [Staphylococcus epidermidis]|uniref:radical SAM protein n=1 Tax=Staphylococcus epidermidis TaxID=1282 RepID=UPI0030EB2FB5